jgi:hypothetical protein
LLFTPPYWKINNLYKWLPAVTSTIGHYSVSSFSCGGCTCFCTMQDRATDSNNLQHKTTLTSQSIPIRQHFTALVHYKQYNCESIFPEVKLSVFLHFVNI